MAGTRSMRFVVTVTIDDARVPLEVADDLLDWLCNQQDAPVWSIDGVESDTSANARLEATTEPESAE